MSVHIRELPQTSLDNNEYRLVLYWLLTPMYELIEYCNALHEPACLILASVTTACSAFLNHLAFFLCLIHVNFLMKKHGWCGEVSKNL